MLSACCGICCCCCCWTVPEPEFCNWAGLTATLIKRKFAWPFEWDGGKGCCCPPGTFRVYWVCGSARFCTPNCGWGEIDRSSGAAIGSGLGRAAWFARFCPACCSTGTCWGDGTGKDEALLLSNLPAISGRGLMFPSSGSGLAVVREWWTLLFLQEIKAFLQYHYQIYHRFIAHW